MTQALAQTPLFDWHVAHGARMVDFAGWSMPVQYSSIVTEHQAVRQAVGLFDVSHMGRFRVQGPGAAAYLDRLLTRRVTDLAPGCIRYSLVTNESGGILDDVLVYHLQQDSSVSVYFLVVNASNRDRIWTWMRQHSSRSDEVVMDDQTLDTAMIAVQGPKALASAQTMVPFELTGLDNYQGRLAEVNGSTWLVSRTGYTGEDGIEFIVPGTAAAGLWQALLDAGKSVGATAAGLGARDTLRLEAAMPLYGHELAEDINPFQAGLRFAVNLQDRDFVGRDALVAVCEAPQPLRRIGLELTGRRVARQDCQVLYGDRPVGRVTSGTFSPTLERPIAMAYVSADAGEIATQLRVDIRGRHEAASVVKLPFYRRPA